eukprot:evm.model.scf_51.2 EVM.evm.TU.scf_51.2   scf_51:8051-18111(-)
MSAAERLHEAEARLADLSQREERLHAQILSTASPNPDVLRGATEPWGHDPQEVASNLTTVMDARQHVSSLQEFQEPMRELERAAKAVVRSVNGDLEVYWQAVGCACDSYRTVAPLCSMVQSTPTELEHTALHDLSGQLLSRAMASMSSAERACREHLEQQLTDCGWPPPLASLSGAPSWGTFWEQLREKSVDKLNGLLLSFAALTMVQMVMEERSGEPVGECLWFMDVMTARLEERLQTHFASDRQTSDIDRPDWLFATALKLLKEHADGMTFFEGRLQPQPVDYALAFQRRIQAAVKGILRSFHLPSLLLLGSGSLWRDWAAAAERFDRGVAEAIAPAGEVRCALSSDVLQGSLNVFCEQQEWMAAWSQAEAQALASEIEQLMAAPDAWQAPQHVNWETEGPQGAAAASGHACSHELWPPRCAEGAWSLVEAAIQRAEGLAVEHRVQYLRNVAGRGLQEVIRKLSAVVRQAESHKQLLAPNWTPKVCGCACAAHYVEHNLRELQFDSSLLEVGGAAALFKTDMTSLVGFRRERCMKLAKSIAMEFGHTSSNYRKQLQIFAGTGMLLTSGVTPTLAEAVLQLHERFVMLSNLLDVVCFREVWRAVAMAATRVMFNDVATEAHFSQQGALLFKSDCEALMEVFRPFCPRPYTHMKELHEACILLNLPTDTARKVYEGSKAPSPRGGISALLKSLGIVRLKPEQAICVLLQRI